MHKRQKMLATLSIINKYFWKTKVAPILSLGIPFGFMLLYFLIDDKMPPVPGAGPSITYISALPSFISLSILPFILITIPQMHADFRNSILLRKIKVSNISKFNYLTLVAIFSAVMSLFFVIIIFLLFLAFGHDTLFSHDSDVNISFMESIDWGGLVYGVLMLIISGIPIGFFIGIISKSPMGATMIGLGVFMLSLALGGQFIPLVVLAQLDALQYITLPSPLNYSLALINSATIPFIERTIISENVFSFEIVKNNIFDLKTPFVVNNFSQELDVLRVYDKWHKGLNLIFPWLISGIFMILNYKFFKWSGR